ncbi:MAG: tRNA (adenosine(37)-N6)-threonylcarbamoyltransferase complex ATPase subunit type 1 TsaE [Bacteriovoracaceae bacterium]
MERIVTYTESATIESGAIFSEQLKAGDVVALYGDLGSGKTRFVKGISRGLGVRETVASPTFTIVNEHYEGRLPLYHFDCYRLRSVTELEEIGFDEYIYGSGVCVVEWAEIIETRLPERRFDVRITPGKEEQERMITIEHR